MKMTSCPFPVSCPEYNDDVQESNDLCLVGEYTEQDDEPVKKVCQFKRSSLRQCSGLPDPDFGYSEGQPCIIIKMNRVSVSLPKQDASLCIAENIWKFCQQ